MTPPANSSEQEIVIDLEDRRYRIRGWGRGEQLRLNLKCSRGGRFHIDVLELYAARQRALFVSQAAKKLDVDEMVLEQDLDQLVVKLEALRMEAQKPTKQPMMTEAEKKAALEFLRNPNLIERILRDFEQCGVVGEKTNKLIGYLAAVSRKLEQPLGVIIQSSSAAGKSSLMEAILAFIPPEEQVKYSAMTGQSLFYMSEIDLKHKILAAIEEEGAQRASYALKLLQSEGELSIASTGKDPITGKLVTHEYRVQGPVALFLTTTSIDMDEELVNRCLVLSVDEARGQTQAIHRLQRQGQTLEGLLRRRSQEKVIDKHRQVQRLLQPLLVVNPYAEALTFVDDRTRTRRDHMKYLILIRTIALLYQYQRPKKKVLHEGETVEYIEVAPSDIALANQLCANVLGRSLDDLPPQTRTLLHRLYDWAKKSERRQIRFTRRQVRMALGLGDTQLKVHLHRLVELEYLIAHSTGPTQPLHYELVYDGKGEDGALFMPGLIEVDKLRKTPQRSGQKEERSALSRPPVGGRSVASRGPENNEKSSLSHGR